MRLRAVPEKISPGRSHRNVPSLFLPEQATMQRSTTAGLPRHARLRGRDAFGRLFREGEGLRRGQLVVKYRAVPRQTPGEGSRVTAGFVTRRNAGPAVKRNRLRRVMRETYRLDRQRFTEALPDGLDLDLVIL